MPSHDSKSVPTRAAEPAFIDEVGRGHGGIVYRGVFQGQPCFIKVPPVSLAETVQTRASFEHEALQLARLQRSGLPRVLHLAQGGERPYVVFSRPKGRVLHEWLLARPSDQAIYEVASALCHALFQLHSLGYVHAELSPSHVFVSDTLQVELLDHGSVHRRVPFEATADLNGLSELLRRCAAQLIDPESAATLLTLAESCRREGASLTELLRALHARLAILQGRALIATGLGVQHLQRYVRPGSMTRRELAQLQQRFHSGGLSAVTVLVAPEGGGKSRRCSSANVSRLIKHSGVPSLS